MWIKRNTLERKLADAMGYEYCTLFDTARSAMEQFCVRKLPSNVCPILRELFPRAMLAPVNPETGLASLTYFQLYGYGLTNINVDLEIDPLMTGFLRKPFAKFSVISFGPKKMLNAGGGGALLSNERFKGKAYFPERLRDPIERALGDLWWHIERQRDRVANWDRYLGDSCVRIPQEQIMPWRVMRRIPEKRDAVVKALRNAAMPVGTNYQPLPGVTDVGALQWGREVINFFPDWNDISGACEIIKRTIAA